MNKLFAIMFALVLSFSVMADEAVVDAEEVQAVEAVAEDAPVTPVDAETPVVDADADAGSDADAE